MDTDDLSKECYRAIIMEAERFNHDLALQFGLLADDCEDENEYIEKSERFIVKLKKAKPYVLSDIFSDYEPDQDDLNKTLDKIKSNINKVKRIPVTNRHFDF